MKKLLSLLVVFLLLLQTSIAGAQWGNSSGFGNWDSWSRFLAGNWTWTGNQTLGQSLGPNLVSTNFTSGWTAAGADWTATASVATHTATGSNSFYSSANATVGQIYKVTFSYTRTAGTLTPVVGGVSIGSFYNASETVTLYVIAATTGSLFLASESAAYAGTITYVSVQAVSGGLLSANKITTNQLILNTLNAGQTATSLPIEFVTATGALAGGIAYYQPNAMFYFVDNSSGNIALSPSGGYVRWSGDTYLYRDTANVLAQRNSTNNQEFRVYNQSTSGSNYNYGTLYAQTNYGMHLFTIGTSGAATSLAGYIQFMTNNANSAGSVKWQITGAGSFLPYSDNAYDIGAQSGGGSGRAKDLYIAGQIYGSSITGGLKVNAIGTPTLTSVTPAGVNDSQTWGYKIVSTNVYGNTTAASTEVTTAAGATWANYDGSTNKNTLAWTPLGGTYQTKIYRTTVPGGGTTGLIATIAGNLSTYVDAKGAGSGSAPTADTTNRITGVGSIETDMITYNTALPLSFMSANVSGAADKTVITTGPNVTTTTGTTKVYNLAPVYNQSAASTANYDLFINRTETAIGSGAQRLISAGTGGGTYVEKWAVDNKGIPYHSPSDYAGSPVAATGPVKVFAYNKNLADDGIITLPIPTTHGWGMAVIGGKTEYSFFYTDNAGAVTLVSNSANTVTTDTDTKFCIYDGGANTIVKNRLGSQQMVSVMFWYN